MRKAKAVFYIVWAAVGLLAAVVLASKWEPILALLAGAFLGLVIAGIAATIVAAWPVIRVIWWWLPELSLASGLVTGWIELASHTALAVRLAVSIGVIGVPAAIGPVRRRISAVAWCQVSRHRVRTCFNEFIITNRTGSLPLILGARPTPAGERLWVFLRPGLSLADIQERTDKIAAGCWASSVIADQASPSNSALVRIDVKRRDPLTGTVSSPLAQLLSGVIPRRRMAAVPPPVALDLPEVSAEEVSDQAARTGPARWPQQPPRPVPAPAASQRDNAADDISDWL